ncbi:hypothetical protein CMO92_00125 [Candidatus Woesearchaeota archaeon]|nr:hypothetical protein [Candidatus Woesearchaeota archaeon]|tara:strand:+ start:499 stop:1149 length:651 start_codon:yes stop_codon:yes gene_type:complete
MERKKINPKKYALTLLITMILFISGLVIGATVSNIKLGKLDDLQQDIRTDTLDIEVQYRLFEEEPCRGINSTPLTDQLYELSLKLDFMENSLGEDDPNVLRLKEYYGLLELRHWVFVRKVGSSCNQTIVPILYFYSNEGDCPKCEEQGFILSYIRKTHPYINVYSFDINIDNGALSTVKRIFKVKDTPTLVVVNSTYTGFQSKAVLKDIIEGRSSS